MPTIGEKLEETRLRHGYSVEDVAHQTRIHPNMIIRIEEDDFSQFPSVAYAKSFIRKYSEHLGVDLGDAMETLNGGVTRLGENELMGEMKKTIHKDRRFRLERTPRALRRRRSDKPAGAPLFLNLILGTLIVSLGLFYFLGYNAPSAQKAKEEIARGLGIELPPEASQAAAPAAAKGPEASAANATAPRTISQGTPPADPTVPVDNPLGSLAPTPAAPGTPPVYPPIKPAVDVNFDDTLKPRAGAAGLAGSAAPETAALPRPRETPRLIISENPVAPPNAANASPTGVNRAEPQPAHLPESATSPKPEAPLQPATPTQGNRPPAAAPAPAPATAPTVRAQPVPAAE